MTEGGAHVLKRGNRSKGDPPWEEISDEDNSCSEDTLGSTSNDMSKRVNRSCGCFDIGDERFARLTSQSKSKFALNVESEDSDADETTLVDMPGAQAIATAETFRADTDFSTGIDPKYRKGDSVWFYRRRQPESLGGCHRC